MDFLLYLGRACLKNHSETFLSVNSSDNLALLHLLPNLRCLIIRSESAPYVESLEGMVNLPNIHSLTLDDVKGLESLAGIQNLNNLKELTIQSCSELVSLEGIEQLSKLTMLSLDNLEKITVRSMSAIEGSLSELTKLFIENCKSLESLESMDTLLKLSTLSIKNCDSFHSLSGIDKETMPNLKNLLISQCQNLALSEEIKSLATLTTIHLGYFDNVESLEILRDMPNLTDLTLRNCSRLNSLRGIATLASLQYLTINNCERLASLEEIEDLNNIEGLEDLTMLTELDFSGCKKLTLMSLPFTKRFPNLTRLILPDGKIFSSTKEIENLQDSIQREQMIQNLSVFSSQGNGGNITVNSPTVNPIEQFFALHPYL